jgi:hypothetical protein
LSISKYLIEGFLISDVSHEISDSIPCITLDGSIGILITNFSTSALRLVIPRFCTKPDSRAGTPGFVSWAIQDIPQLNWRDAWREAQWPLKLELELETLDIERSEFSLQAGLGMAAVSV